MQTPTVIQTPCGDLRRQWAVLDRTNIGQGRNERLNTEFWAVFPPILNDQMNQEIDQWSTVADKMEGQDLVVTYNWSTYDKQNGWELVECVIDLHTMTQRNTRSGTERAVKYFYVPMEVDP